CRHDITYFLFFFVVDFFVAGFVGSSGSTTASTKGPKAAELISSSRFLVTSISWPLRRISFVCLSLKGLITLTFIPRHPSCDRELVNIGNFNFHRQRLEIGKIKHQEAGIILRTAGAIQLDQVYPLIFEEAIFVAILDPSIPS